MQVYIMRHGEAQDFIAPNSNDDSQRVLTVEGKAEAQKMAAWFDEMKIKPKHVFVSPYLRAQQTCAIVTEKMDSPITTINFISPLDEAKPVHDFIDGWISEQQSVDNETLLEEGSLLIISHMPLVCFLVAELTQPDNAPIFSTGAVAHIDYDINKMQGNLTRLISPIETC